MDEIRSGEWTVGSIFKNSRDSLANVPSRKGIMQSRPSDLIWTAENRSKGERGRVAGRNSKASAVEAMAGGEELGGVRDSRPTATVFNGKGTRWKRRLRRAHLAASH